MISKGFSFIAVLIVAWAMFATAVYLPDVGRGFVKDDFGWVEAGRAALHAPADALMPRTPGFYRPAVAFTFAADYLLHDVRPRGYGFTNLALYLACIGAILVLCRALGLSPAAATLAAVLWGANPHGINMALVWISGRTSLCLTLFAVLSAIALVKRRYVWTAVCVAGALASKEEAVLLPAILLAWHWLLIAGEDDDGARRRVDWRLVVAVGVPAALYVAVRMQTGAFTPSSAPAYYRFSFAPAFVLSNLFEYTDRAATIGAIALLITAAVYRLTPSVDRSQRRLLAACLVWYAGGYSLTLFLPVRSSLYAVFPSVGAVIACAAIVEGMMARAANQRAHMLRLGGVMAVVLLAMVPAYRARNGRYVEPARFSERALRTIERDAPGAPAGGVIVLHDVTNPASSFVGAFGTFASNAVRLHSGNDVNVWIEPPPGDWQLAGLRPPRPREATTAFAVDRGRIFRVAR
jgi:hypothetical protein